MHLVYIIIKMFETVAEGGVVLGEGDMELMEYGRSI